MPHDADNFKEDRIYWKSPEETLTFHTNTVSAAQTEFRRSAKTSRNHYVIASGSGPVVAAITPTTHTGAPASSFTLTVDGRGFTASSKVWFKGVQQTTTFVSATRVTASITVPATTTASDVFVKNGDAMSNTVRLTITVTRKRAA